MIEKLRKKFISIAAGALFALIFLVLVAVNGFFIYSTNMSLNVSLDRLLNMHGFSMQDPEDFKPGPRFDMEIFGDDDIDDKEPDFVKEPPENMREDVFGSFFEGRLNREFNGAVVFLDENGRAVDINQSFEGLYDEDELCELAEELFIKRKKQGFSGYYKYKIVDIIQDDARYKVALINASNELYSVFTMLLISLITAIVSFGIVLFIIIRAAGRAIRPIAESYEKQKRFITDAGHELKTPLTVISTNNDVARLSFGESELFDTIERQVGRMNSLVKSLISLAKMDEEQKPEFAVFNLSDAVYDTAESFKMVAKSRGRELLTDIKDEVYINGDESKLRQLTAILIDNAVKYCDESGEIYVNLIISNRIHLKVVNDYKNVGNIKLDNLFERFYRADEARSYDGSYGLGLPIAKSIAGLHGGELTVKNVDGNKIMFDAALKK